VGRTREYRARRNWPDRLYARRRGNRVHYYFRIPGTRRDVALGTDLRAAKRAVAIYWAQNTPGDVTRALNQINKPVVTVREHFTWFAETELSERRTRQGKPLASKTLYEYQTMLDHAVRQLGADRAVAEVTRRAIAELLESYPLRMSNRYRSLLSQVFKHSVARGLRMDNPVDATIARRHTVQRRRLDKPSFDAIYEAAEPWLQRTMDLALWSLQRREDIVQMRVRDWQGAVLSVRQRKVQGHGTDLLRITPGHNLRAALIACLNSPERDDCSWFIGVRLDALKPLLGVSIGFRSQVKWSVGNLLVYVMRSNYTTAIQRNDLLGTRSERWAVICIESNWAGQMIRFKP